MSVGMDGPINARPMVVVDRNATDTKDQGEHGMSYREWLVGKMMVEFYASILRDPDKFRVHQLSLNIGVPDELKREINAAAALAKAITNEIAMLHL